MKGNKKGFCSHLTMIKLNYNSTKKRSLGVMQLINGFTKNFQCFIFSIVSSILPFLLPFGQAKQSRVLSKSPIYFMTPTPYCIFIDSCGKENCIAFLLFSNLFKSGHKNLLTFRLNSKGLTKALLVKFQDYDDLWC